MPRHFWKTLKTWEMNQRHGNNLDVEEEQEGNNLKKKIFGVGNDLLDKFTIKF